MRYLYFNAAPVSRSMMELGFSPFSGEVLPLNLYRTYVGTRPSNRLVSSFCVKVARMIISSCGIILIYFLGPYIVCCKHMVLWVQLFCVYPPL